MQNLECRMQNADYKKHVIRRQRINSRLVFILCLCSVFCVLCSELKAESLWQFDESSMSFFGDQQRRARKVGDTVSVEIVERSLAKREGSTKADKSSAIKAGVGNWQFGELTDASKLPSFELSSSASHNGGGTISSSDNMVANISATVVKVLGNGNLVIEGRRSLVVNNDYQIITISGIVRPQDISSNNTILSIYVAEAEIRYENKGLLGDKQKRGWVSRFFDFIWIF